jgi:dTDP-4-amino-4,6-dideoxygalactose transaminase/RimJ/RimL family protein N-acetyltransferase
MFPPARSSVESILSEIAVNPNEVAIRLRRATMADAELLLVWANDPDVRRASFNTTPIDRETHIAWLRAQLDSADTAFYICECDGGPIGYARVERRDDSRGEIAVSVDTPHRGQGIGRRLIGLASARAGQELGLAEISARVKSENAASLVAFERAGFVGSGDSGMMRLLLNGLIVPHSRPFVGDAEAAAAASTVRSRALAQGPAVAELEAEWRVATGTVAAVCVGSGVAALRLGLHALGIGPGDEVIVPAYSCVALLNAPLSLGATPVLADVERDDWTLAVDDVARRITRRTRAIIAVDLFGMPARLADLADFDLPVFEDCAHGIGGRTSAGPFGSGSQLSMSSFHATKLLGAGEGGIVAGRDPGLIDRVRYARDYGDRLPNAAHLNDKLTDVEAAIALVQLRRLGEILRRRAERAAVYTSALSQVAERGLVVLPEDRPGRIWYRYAVRLTVDGAHAFCERMAARGVRAEQPVWDLRACKQWREGLDQTVEAFERVVSLPLYPDLGRREQELVCDVFADAVEGQ